MFRRNRIAKVPLLCGRTILFRAGFSASPVVPSPSSLSPSNNVNTISSSPTPSSSFPRSPSFTSSTNPIHIVWHLLKQKGPLTRKEIEEVLHTEGLFDIQGQAARRRLLNNKTAMAQNNRTSLPSKPTSVPRSKLLPLVPPELLATTATEQQQQQEPKKVLSSKRVAEAPILSFVQVTPEFRQIAKVKRELVFPSTHLLKDVLIRLKRHGKIETKPKAGQAVRGRRIFAYGIKEGSVPMMTPEEFEASGKKAKMETRLARTLAAREQRLTTKKEAWASYINGEEHRVAALLDPRILEEREEARREKMLGLKA